MTLYETVGQLQVFVWMLAAGALMGAWYAVTALLRRLLEAGTWLGLCADAAFGLGAGAIFCLALYTANRGQVRLYAVLAAMLGFALFAGGVYPPGKRAISATIVIFRRIIVIIRNYRWINVIFK